MAMLPVGLTSGYVDASYDADTSAVFDPPPTNADTDQSVRREGETSNDSESQKSWTRTHTDSDKPTFKDALHKTQRSSKSDPSPSTPATLQVVSLLPASITALPPVGASLLSADQADAAGNPNESSLSPQTALPSADAAEGSEAGDKAEDKSAASLLKAVDPKAQSQTPLINPNLSESSGDPSTFGNGKQQGSSFASGDSVVSTSLNATEMSALLQQTLTVPKDAAVNLSSTDERVAVARQVSDQMVATAQQANVLSAAGQHTVTINVHPDHWGELKITLSMDTTEAGAGAKNVTATIIAGSSAVRDALAGQSKELQDSLQNAGIKLDKLEITVAGQLNTTNPTHSASEMGFNSNSQNSNNSQTSSHGQGHTRSFSADTSGQQQRSGQQFAALFDNGSGSFGQSQGGWQSAISASADISTESSSILPIGLVEATSAGIHGVNVLA